MIKHFFKQLRYVKLSDILSGFLFFLALPAAMVMKKKRPSLWLVCERSEEARDNGYWFYKYVCENHPEQDIVYAINKDGMDYHKIVELSGEVIEYGSLKHWVYYLAADINISSQKGGKPNAALCYFLEIYGFLKNRRVFLQHGVTKDAQKWLYYNVTKTWLLVCSSQRELEHFMRCFSYPREGLTLTGLSRFDNLDRENTDDKTIIIMPTMREWLSRPVKNGLEYELKDFTKTQYFQSWEKVLTDPEIEQLIEEQGYKVLFYLHPNMQKYASDFESIPSHVRIVRAAEADIQVLLKKAGMMITDYSSVFFDMAYMKKPVIYYQFDEETFRKYHYQKGYFSYEDDGFGPVVYNKEELIDEILHIVDNRMQMADTYLKRAEYFFEFFDNKNSERIFHAICKKRSRE